MLTDRQYALALARTTLAADCGCDEQAFLSEGVVIVPAKVRPGRRRFPVNPRPLFLATFGAGVVVSCHPDRTSRLVSSLGSMDRDEVFSASTVMLLARLVESDGQVVRGPSLKHLCSRSTLREVEVPEGIDVSLVVGDQVRTLYGHAGFRNALCYQPDSPTPDVLAAVARREGEVVGIAGASADSDELWQIGIDVVPTARGLGIGRALVHRLTSETIALGRVPYYSAALSNLRSLGLAVAVGYWPAWVELRAVDPQ